MNKKTLLSLMMLCFVFFGMARADELTVHDSTDINGFIPMYGGYFDDFTKSEFVFPASELADMTGSTISSMKFYVSGLGNSLNGWNTTQQVFLKEVASETLSDYSGIEGATIVFEGSLTAPTTSPSELEITFSTPYTYNGGNLLVGIYNTTKGNFQFVYFYGETVTGASGAGYNSTSLANVSFTQRNFLPKTTFKYGCVPPVQFTANEVGPSFATLSWTEVGNSESWYIYYYVQTYGTTGPEEESIEVFENPYTLAGLNPYTTYEAYVIPSCGVVDDDPDNSLMSNTITFTTLEFCPTPQNVAVANITDTEATVTWSDYNEVYEVQLGTLSDNSEILLNESFDNGFSNNNDWYIDPTYPWITVDDHMQSNNAGVENSTSSVTLSMYLYDAGTIQFDAECRGEGTGSYLYDKCIFSIDSIEQFAYGAQVSGWNHYSFDVAAGEHTFTWSYTKDHSVDPDGDYFAVDNVVVGINEYEWGNSISVENPPYTFTGLDPVTEYYVHVMGVCGLSSPRPTITGWSEPLHFTTLGYYTVTVDASPTNAGTVTGGGEFLLGETCTVSAVPNAHFYFDYWSKNGSTMSYDSIYSFTVTEDVNLVAEFSPITYYAWVNSYPQIGGNAYFVEHDPVFHYGDTVTLHASPNVDYEFVNWTVWNGNEYVPLSSDTVFTLVWNDDFLSILLEEPGEQDGIEFVANFIGDCMPPTQLTATEVGPNFATLNWTELGTSESWYVFYQDTNPSPTYIPFDTIQVTENPFTLPDLQPNTTYNVYVVPSCGVEYGEPNETLMSETIIFTTLDACPIPQNIEVTNVTHSAVTVTWSDYNDSYFVQLGLLNPNNVVYETFANNIPSDWTNDATHPWTIVNGHMQSGNAGVSNSTSEISVTLTYPSNGFIDFDAECKGEGTEPYMYDKCIFSIDGEEQFTYGELSGWNHYCFDVAAGSHTFTWKYTKDSSWDTTGDHFAVDNVRFTKAIGWNNAVSAEDATITLTDLTPLTMYCLRVQGQCIEVQQTTTDWSQPVFFTTLEAYTISVSANPANAGTVSGGGEYGLGESCTISATANTGYRFINWTKNGQQVSTSSSYTFEVTGAASYVANFELQSFNITVSADPTEGGTVSGGGTYNYGASCTLSATPNPGYVFYNWTKNGRVVSWEPEHTFNIVGAGSYVANFVQIEFNPWFTIIPEDGGSAYYTVGNENNQPVHYGDEITLIATPNVGYNFVNWDIVNIEDTLFVSNQANHTFTMDNTFMNGLLEEIGSGEIEFIANFSLKSYQITASTAPDGAGTINGAGTYMHGDSCTLSVTPNLGYTFVNWTKNGTQVSTNTSFTFNVTENAAYVANFTVNGYQITATTNPTGAGTITGAGPYDYGQICTLTATANEGYTFANWTLNGTVVGTNPAITFTVSGSAAYVANFSVNSYEITASANPTAGGTVTGANTYNFGEQATLTANANTGYTFINWTENGNVVSTSPTYNFTVEGPRTLVANFQLNSYEITASANPTAGGTVTGANTYNFGEQATLTANANTGYTFVNWTENGNVVSTSPTYSFTVEGPRTLVANFSVNGYEITASTNPTGAGTITGAGPYDYGQICTLTATANEGYTFANWTLNGTVVGTNPAITFTVSGSAAYVANFSVNSYEITASANPTAGGTVTGANTYNFGEQATLTANANTGYTFINWTENGNVVSTSPTYSFTVEGPRTLVANFQLNSYEITASANPTAGGSVTGANTYNFGEQATLTANANTGYTFINWTENGNVVSTSPSYSFTVEGPRTLVANFSVNGYEITASTNPTGAGTITGAGPYDYGQTCTLTATANEGYTFANWTLNGTVVGTNPTITFTVSGSAAYVANFSVNSYEITASANPTAGGTVTGANTYNFGEQATLTANANTGYTFINWTENGNVVSTSPSYSFTVEGPRTLVANFQLNSYEITASANPAAGGTVTGANTYNFGEQATLTANANTGYTFINWTENGNVVSTSPTYSFTVEGPRTLVANFQLNSYEITASANPTAGGSVTGANTYNFGEQATLTANANTGYTFINWTENGNVVSNSPTYSFTVEGPRTLVANFQLNSYEITASANPTAGGTVTGANTYNFGEQATLTANANTGYTFINWTENGNVVSTSPTYSFTVEGPRTLVANFSLNSYAINASANPTAGGSVTGANTYNFGEQATLTANANTGYTFINWTENGNVVSTSPTYSFTVEGPRTLVANFSLNSYAINASANPTAGGSVTGANTYNFGEQATLTANANTGYTFINWTENGNVVSNSPTYSFTVEGPRTLVANFSLNSYAINASANPTAGGSVTGANTYNFGEQATLTANANTGYTFINWTENGNVVSNSPTYSFTVEGPRTLVANFQLNSYEITASANPAAGGSVSGAGTYDHFETCTLIATESTGYTFTNWTENGNVVSNSPTYSFTVEGPRTLVANFQLNSYEITASANPAAGGSVSGAGTYDHFETCTLIATESTGYTFTNWTENGNVVSTSPTYSFTVEGPRTLVANFQLNSYEITASANPAAGGSVSGAGTYDHFETCTLIATESTGYTFTNWTENGNVVSTSPTYSFTVEGPRTLVANFQLNSYEITASANPAAGGSVSGAGTYDHFETCTLIATESTGYTFTNWTENGNVVSTSPTYSFTVEGPRTLVANFQLNSYEITASANPSAGGSVSGAGTYDHFETCTLIATESTGYTFINWTENGNVVSTSPTYSFTVEGPRTLVANFQINSYVITAIANPNAGGTVSGGGTYNHFETCTLVATPNAYYEFTNWTKDGQVVSTNATYYFTVEGGGTYVAHFTRVSHQITALANPTEGGSVSGAGSFTHGSYCTLIATANTGYTFFSWTKNGVVMSSSPSYSFSVTEDATYVANFNLNMYMVTVSADPTTGGTVTGGGTFQYGESCTVFATPAAGYSFTNWTKNGTVVSTDALYTFSVLDNTALVAHFSLDHYNITVSVDPEAGGTATGGGNFIYGETCTLTATPNTGYAFVNWTKNGSVMSSNANYSFTVYDDGDYVAHFAVARYTLTVVAEPAEGGSVSGGGTFNYGNVATLRANANEGYDFVNWTKDGVFVSTNAILSVIVREDAEYVANFRINTFEIKANTDPFNTGDIEGAGFYSYGETCTLTVTPHENYEFVNWTLNGQVVSEDESISFIVREERNYVAHLQYVDDGIDEQGGITATLYPNPARFRMTIEASEPIKMLEIYTIDGAFVSKQECCSDKIVINVENYASGTYMIRLTTDSAVEIRRFVKE